MRSTPAHPPSRPPAPRAATRPVQSISSLPAAARHDHDRRVRNYAISMGIRTACFALAGVLHLALDWTVLSWVCMIAALVLPYPAVVLANARDGRVETMPMTSPTRRLSATAWSGQDGPAGPR